ncbi:MAG: aspartic peptidase domain-containing protein [Podila humilis]|nr:MAG: aspartic peptidase domain-containing protein [Podila humilis]
MTLQSLAILILVTLGTIQAEVVSVPFTNFGYVGVVNVGVGAGTYSLIIDNNSANTWVGAGKPYQPGPNSQDTGGTVQVSYENGDFSGEEFTDDVTLGSVTIPGQSIGVASTWFNGFDGILGLGPTALSEGTVSNEGEVPTVVDNLYSQGIIDSALFAISAAPTISINETNGEITFGGVESSKFTGDINFTPITSTSPANQFWGLDATFQYGDSRSTVLSTTAGTIESATSLLLLATDGFEEFQQLTGAVLDQTTGLLSIEDASTLQSLYFIVNGVTYEITANALIWPRSMNSAIGGTSGSTYLIVGDLGTPSGQGLDFMIGYTILQRFYTVFDTTNALIGIATTSHTYDTSN